jgi:chromosome segregation ATPase
MSSEKLNSHCTDISLVTRKRKKCSDETYEEQVTSTSHLNTTIARLQADLTISNAVNQGLQKELKLARIERSDMEIKQRQTTLTITALQEENEILKKCLTDASAKICQLTEDFDEANGAIAELEIREVDDRKYLHALNLKALAAMSELQTARLTITQMATTLTEKGTLKKVNKGLEKKLKGANAQIFQLTEDFYEANAAIKEMEIREIDDRKYLHALNRKALDAMSDLQTARLTITHMNDTLTEFREDMNIAENKITTLKSLVSLKDILLKQKDNVIEDMKRKESSIDIALEEPLEEP